MRRGACLLALLGMTVQSAVGDDTMGSARLAPAGKAAAPAAAPSAAATPQKYTRGGAAPAAQPASADELRNYYNELFGAGAPAQAPSQAPTAAAPTASKSPVVKPIPAQTPPPVKTAIGNPADESKIVHAEFQQDPATAQGNIEQVRAERFGARPFPGFAEAPAAAPQTLAPAAGSVQPAKASLTQPISMAPAATAASATAAPAPKGGAVNFTKSTPAAARSTTAPSRSASEMSESAAVAAPSVTLEWRKQSDINVGQECKCQLVVKNCGQTPARDVEIRAYFPSSVRLVAAHPAPTASESFVGWQVPELKAGEEKIMEVAMIPLQRGEIATKADVRFSGTADGLFAVAEPMLELQVEGPAQVLIGEPASQTVTVTNPGTGIANHVMIEAVLPEGLEHARGQRLQMDLGSLNPGESRSVRLALAATKGGRHHLDVQARAESGLVRTASSDVSVIAPSLTAQIAGPGLRYIGRHGAFTLTVSNDGAAATDNVQVRYKVPSGFEFISADKGAQFDRATGLVTWFVGRLEKGQTAEIKVTLNAREAGSFKHLVRATSEHGVLSDAEMTTVVDGSASLALEVKDLEDPVEVGAETVYEVRVKNEGSAAAHEVGVACELPAGMKFISAEGPSRHVAERGAVMFQALPELAAGQTATYKVRVSAAAPGSLRFKAHLTSRSIEEPLTGEELTKFYGE